MVKGYKQMLPFLWRIIIKENFFFFPFKILHTLVCLKSVLSIELYVMKLYVKPMRALATYFSKR